MQSHVDSYQQQVERALQLLPDVSRCCEALNRTYRRLLDDETRSLSISLVGPFAQTDYLLKQHRADRQLRRRVGNMRVAFRSMKPHSEHDCRVFATTLALFIELVKGEAPTVQQYGSPDGEESIDIEPDILDMDSNQPSDASSSPRWKTGCLRFILDSWDEQMMYGRVDSTVFKGVGIDDEDVRLDDGQLMVYYADEHAYLRSMLYANAQFNLVQPRMQDGVVRARHIILEPDYLVNITSVAACFEEYTESPYVYLLKRMLTNKPTEHTLLGHLAGQLLDESLHNEPGTVTPYVESARDFFQHQATALMTAQLPPDFHDRARQQGENIRRAVGETLPNEVGAFRREDVLLEPSFYSEMLGLSGRMDLLQHDMKVLIEQKSGKAAFVPGQKEDDAPRQTEQHYVQMLLYMLLVRYNYPERYFDGVEGIQAFLMYSKYKHSLVKLDFAPQLVSRALCVRNGIAWIENQLGAPKSHTGGKKGGVEQHRSSWSWRRLLDNLTPEQINTKGVNSKLWIGYQRPAYDELLRPIHQASALERSYYYRMLDFLSREHLLAKVGSKQRQNAGFAAAWHDALSDKRQAGNIYDRLRLEGVSPLTLRFTDTENNDMANFRVGDIVVLYPYRPGTEPDIRRSMVHRATIQQITTETIALQLRAEQTDPMVFYRHEQDEWAIEHDLMEASFQGLYRGMHSFLSAPKERRDLILLQREPLVDTEAQLRGEYGQFNDLMLRVRQARDLFLIIGPPGTGKTSFGMLNTLKEELLQPDSRILLLSYTNRAVDEICSKLIEEGIDFLRFGNEFNTSEESRPYLFRNRCQSLQKIDQIRELYLSARVVCATTSTMSGLTALLAMRPFSLCIIDEASQILEPHLMALLSATCQNEQGFDMPTLPAIQKIVMIGDHKQLPAVVQQSAEDSAVIEPELQEIGLTNCRLSFFERLLHRYRDRHDVVYMLTRQGRMHRDIADFPNHAFYGGRLAEVPLPHQVAPTPNQSTSADQLQQLIETQRVAFIDVPKPESSISDKVNQSEANVIARAVMVIHRLHRDDFDVDHTVGIIVPYRNQIATVRNTIDRLAVQEGLTPAEAERLHNIAIDTVERYQGSQRRYIIYGFTVQQPYQLDFLTDNTFEEDGQTIDRKLNVALTRAMDHMLLVGNAQLLSRVPLFEQLIERYINDNNTMPSA